MESFSLVIVVGLTVASYVAFLQRNVKARIAIITLSVLASWYMEYSQFESITELSWQKYNNGLTVEEPNDGAQGVFIALFGWLPAVIYCAVLGIIFKFASHIYGKYFTGNKSEVQNT